MTARLIKETRELLVIWIGTLLLIVVPFLLNGASAAPFGAVAFGLGCAVLAGCSFGNEFQHRTLALLLSQPISRSAVWLEKMLVLGTGIASSLAALWVCQGVWGAAPDQEASLVPLLIALCAFCGAPYWTLVCRQPLVGMASAAGFPIALLGGLALIGTWLGRSEPVELGSATILLTLYCAVVFWRGHSRFKQMEVVDSFERELSLPAGVEAALARPLGKVSSRYRGPFASLLKKELRLQQVSLLLAGVFFLIAVIGFCVLPLYRPLGVGILGGDYGVFVLVLPLVAGAIAVAEEKGWGLSEWHLTLPPSACQQWSAKMLATLSTSTVLGLLLPAAMLLAGQPLLRGNAPGSAAPPVYGLGAVVFGQLLFTSAAVYAASFSKTTLRAILAALGILVSGSWATALAATSAIKGVPPMEFTAHMLQGHSPLPVVYVSLLLLLGLTQWFAWSNFRRSGAPVRQLVLQLLLLLLAVGLGSTTIFATMRLVASAG
jgi:ABC-type transport system involved in multi-copper enzyme maturation permease subunit